MTKLIDYIDAEEGRDTPVKCFNCGDTANLTPIALNGAILDNAWGCDDCIEEQQHVEAQAEELAGLPSCEERQRIIDTSETVQRLLNALRAHDQSACAACAAARVCDDCGEASNDTTYDPAFQVRICPACALKLAQIDGVLGRVA